MEQPRGPVSPRPTSHKSRNFSFGAKSDKSSGKVDLTESPKDKNQRDSVWKATHKSNPNAAMSEAQPGGTSKTTATLLHHPLHNSQAFANPFSSFPPSLGPRVFSDNVRPNHSCNMAATADSDLHAKHEADSKAAVAAYMEQSTLDSLRGVQHKDVHGNVICKCKDSLMVGSQTS